MVQERRRRFIDRFRRAVWSDAAERTTTAALPIIDDAMAVRIIDLAMRTAEVMLSVGASAKEVTLAAMRITQAYGLRSVHVNITYNSVTVSDHRDGDEHPITLMRVVYAAVPDHAKLQRLQALVTDIESGMDLADARAHFHRIRRTPFLYRPAIVAIAQALLAVGVGMTFGAQWSILLVTFIAALCVALTQAGLARLRVPMFFSQIAGAFVLTSFTVGVSLLARLGVEPFVDVRPSIVVSSGIVLMLAGLAVVGAAQDAIDGFSLTAGGRILELTVQTLGLVLGILMGLQFASALGAGLVAPTSPLPFGAAPGQFAGAALVALAVAVLNGAGLRTISVSVLLALTAWAGYFVTTAAGVAPTAASFVGAFAASLIGTVIAYRFGVPSVAVTTAAIIPLVPGAAVFRGLLGLVESEGELGNLLFATESLLSAAMVGIALAAGATLGLFLGSPLRAGLRGPKLAARQRSAGTSRLVVPSQDESRAG